LNEAKKQQKKKKLTREQIARIKKEVDEEFAEIEANQEVV